MIIKDLLLLKVYRFTLSSMTCHICHILLYFKAVSLGKFRLGYIFITSYTCQNVCLSNMAIKWRQPLVYSLVYPINLRSR